MFKKFLIVMTMILMIGINCFGAYTPTVGGIVSNQTSLGVNTNLSLLQYPAQYEANDNVRPVPQVYFFYGAQTNTEAYIRGIADIIYTNGYVGYGLDWYEQDLIYFTRDGSGNIQYNTTNYPSGGAALVKYFHDRGIKYYGYDGLRPGGEFGLIGSYGYEQKDAWTFATNFNWDGVKFDYGVETGDLTEVQLFCCALFNTSHPFFIQCSDNRPPYVGASWNASPFYHAWINSSYSGYTLNDTDAPHNFTNIMAHFDAESVAAQFLTRPGHYVQGCGWLDAPNQLYVTNGLECAAILAEDVMISPFAPSSIFAMFTNNPCYLSILRDKAVIPGHAVYTNVATDGQTNAVWVRPLEDKYGQKKYVMFLNRSIYASNLVVSSTNMCFTNQSPFTLVSPWSGTIEAWATNTYTNALMTQNTTSFEVFQGLVYPNFSFGTNWLSSFPWRLASSNYPTVNIRSGNNPIIINSVTYTNGFVTQLQGGSGPFTNTYIEFPLGGITTNFTCTFGIISAWSGAAAGGRLTITLDGVQVYQSQYITNDAQYTNISVNTTGKNAIGLYIDDSAPGQYLQMAIANAQVFYPPIINYPLNITSFNVTNGIINSPGAAGLIITNGTNLSLALGQLPSGGREAIVWVVPGSTYDGNNGSCIYGDNSQVTENVPTGGNFYWRINGTTVVSITSGQLNADLGLSSDLPASAITGTISNVPLTNIPSASFTGPVWLTNTMYQGVTNAITNITLATNAALTLFNMTWSTNRYFFGPTFGWLYISNILSVGTETVLMTNYYLKPFPYGCPPLVQVQAMGTNSAGRGNIFYVENITTNFFCVVQAGSGLTNTGYGVSWTIYGQTNFTGGTLP